MLSHREIMIAFKVIIYFVCIIAFPFHAALERRQFSPYQELHKVT